MILNPLLVWYSCAVTHLAQALAGHGRARPNFGTAPNDEERDMATAPPKAPPRDFPLKVQAAIKRLRDAHARGKLLLEVCPFGRSDRENTMVAEAKKHRVNLDTAYKLRAFADERRGYTDRQLEVLCDLCEIHGRALGVSFVIKFVTIHNKTERAKFQQETIVKGWSLIQVRLTLAARRGSQALHGLAGKRPKIRDLDDFLADVAAKCVWWQRLHKMLADSSRDPSEGSALSLATIPGAIRGPFESAVESIKQLDAALKKRLGIRRLAKDAAALQRNASTLKTTGKSVSNARHSKRHKKGS